MSRVLYFVQLPGQYQLSEIPFHFQTNCSRFVEHTLAKSGWWKVISYILANTNEEIFSFFTIVISFKLKKYQHNTDAVFCNLFQYSRNLLLKFYYKIKQPAPPPPFTRGFSNNNWLVIFGEFPRNCSIRWGTVLSNLYHLASEINSKRT